MNYWIIPCNLKNFDVISAFRKHQEIQWKQSVNASIGDEAYIYVAWPESRLMFKCIITEVNLPSVKVDDSEFVIDGSPFLNHGRYLTLKLIEKYDSKAFSLEILKNNGLKGNLQSTIKANSRLKIFLNGGVEDFLEEDNLTETNLPRVPTVDVWKKIIEMENEREINNKESMMPYFRYLMEFNNFAMDATSIAGASGKNVGTMNLEMERFGKRVIKEFSISEQIREDSQQKRYWNIPFTGQYLKHRRFEYTLRKELVEALQSIQSELTVAEYKNKFEEILEYIIKDKKEFNSYLKQKVDIHNSLERLRKDFVAKFNIKFIEKMTLNDYVLGRMKINPDENKLSFCYQIETTLKDLGSIKGGFSDKFGIYYDQIENTYKVSKKWGNSTEEAFPKIKTNMIQLILDGKEMNYTKIHENPLSPMLKSKILSVYYPDVYLPIFNEEHVDKFLFALGIHYDPKVFNTFELKKKLLVNYKEDHPILNVYQDDIFMEILYHPSLRTHLLGKEIEEIVIDENDIELISWDYIRSIEKVESEKVIIRKKADYIKAAENKIKIGELGEETILRYEKNRLMKLGYKDLADKVIRLSETSNSYGYDILSFDILYGQISELHIEVKTSKSSDAVLNFYLTENELKKFHNDSCHKIYYLFDVAKNAKLHIVDKTSFKKDFLKPVLYKVEVLVKPKDLSNN